MKDVGADASKTMISKKNQDDSILPSSEPLIEHLPLETEDVIEVQDVAVLDPLLAKDVRPVPENFSQKILSGVSWTLFSSAVTQVLNLVRSVMLARLLSQEDFGIGGMATTVLGAVCVLTNIGLSGSSITAHFKDDNEKRRYVDTIWTLELSRGFFIGVLMSLAALPTSLFYRDQRLLPVVLILAWIPFIGSLRNVGLVMMTREMDFARFTIVNLIETVVSVAAAIFLAWSMRSYWALVWAQAGSALFGLLLSYLFHPYRSRLCFDHQAMRVGMNFGKYIFFIGVASFIVTTMDNIVLGRLLGASTLGAYLIAFSASSLLTNVLGQVLGSVFFPTFARLRHENIERIKSAATRSFTVGSLLLTIATVPFMLLSPEIITVLYGAKWLNAAEPMRLLAMVGFLRGVLGLLNPILMGMNRPDIESRIKIVEAGVFLIAIYPLIRHFGMVGAATTGILTFVVSLFFQYRLTQKTFPGMLDKIPQLLLISVISIAIGFSSGNLILNFLSEQHDLVRITLGTLTSTFASFLSFYKLCPQAKEESLTIFKILKTKLIPAK